MKAWQKYIARHHDIEVISDTSVRVRNIALMGGQWHDDILTYLGGYYVACTVTRDGHIADTMQYQTIRDYLGY